MYLLGLYLGDGCISRAPRDVYKLRIALDRRYPQIIEECVAAMQAVVPWNRVRPQTTNKGYVEVHAYSKTWLCLFPQHGAGKKHERKIALADWQRDDGQPLSPAARSRPDPLRRLPIHQHG
ncbi:MAG: hypothetical protein ACM3N0_10980 [Chloroflexota bacterium]